MFSEQICEWKRRVRYVLRKNEKEAARERHRLEDKLEKLKEKIAARNEQVKNKPRCRPEAGQRQLQAWTERHKLTGLVELSLTAARWCCSAKRRRSQGLSSWQAATW